MGDVSFTNQTLLASHTLESSTQTHISMEDIPLVTLDSNNANAAPCCESCTKRFRRFYRAKYSCHDCGKSVCSKCLCGQVCAGCDVKKTLSPLVQWAAAGSEVPFDVTDAIETL